MDPNETLRLFRRAMRDARDAAEDDSNDAEIQALQDAVGYAEALDDWLAVGGALPDQWREDQVSSASRQHYIDTGRYLTRDDYTEDVSSCVDALPVFRTADNELGCPHCREVGRIYEHDRAEGFNHAEYDRNSLIVVQEGADRETVEFLCLACQKPVTVDHLGDIEWV